MRDSSTPWDTLEARGARPREITHEEYCRLLLSRRHLQWVWGPHGPLEDQDSGERFVLRARSGGATAQGA